MAGESSGRWPQWPDLVRMALRLGEPSCPPGGQPFGQNHRQDDDDDNDDNGHNGDGDDDDDDDDGEHQIHYPLNGLDLDFHRYWPGRYGPPDIMAHHIFQDFLFPSRVTPATYRLMLSEHGPKALRFKPIELRNTDLALDLRTLNAMLLTKSLILSPRYSTAIRLPPTCLARQRDNTMRVQDAVHDIVQRFYLERDNCLVRRFLRNQKYVASLATRNPPHRPRRTPLPKEEAQHLGQYYRSRQLYQELFLYSGPDAFTLAGYSNSLMLPKHDFFINFDVERSDRGRQIWRVMLQSNDGFSRSKSEPAPNSYFFAYANFHGDQNPLASHAMWPKLSLQQLDHRTRRRSLSRRHIARMFLDAPLRELRFRSNNNRFSAQNGQGSSSRSARYRFSGSGVGEGRGEIQYFARDRVNRHGHRFGENHYRNGQMPPLCSNCRQRIHGTNPCPFACGHCGSGKHQANQCRQPARMRCKCCPYPQFHLVDQCRVHCSRPCGNPFPPGHLRHKNAMTCKSRCCMCGISGHAGAECRHKTCRCGWIHLGQDCSWHPTCRVKGCGKYLCGLHCHECGSTQRPFVGWRCEACLHDDKPARPGADN